MGKEVLGGGEDTGGGELCVQTQVQRCMHTCISCSRNNVDDSFLYFRGCACDCLISVLFIIIITICGPSYPKQMLTVQFSFNVF